jgi:glycosyltransferase involved in cell wall biosynthesis
VPHGLSPELLEESLPTTITGLSAKRSIPGLDKSIGGRKVILTVGNWQRDFNSLQETAKLFLAQEDVIFVLVSKGLILDTNNLKNVLVLNQGVTDSQLHALYRRSTLLFLPLHDSAANNAILEAMAHGLPIVTTDLLSTRYYTNNKAVFVKPGATAYAAALQEVLTKLKQPSQRMAITRALRQRASELVWKKIAITMHEKLYSPLLTRTKGGQL